MRLDEKLLAYCRLLAAGKLVRPAAGWVGYS